MEDNKNVNLEGFLLDDSKKSIRSKNSSSLSLVPNALVRNMSHTRESINKLKNELGVELKEEVVKALADDEGNEVRLTRTEKLILLSLAYIIYTPELRSKDKKEEKEKEEKLPNSPQTLWINLAQLCGFVYGEGERKKPSRQKELERILEEMSNKKFVIFYKCLSKDEEGKDIPSFVQRALPYFYLTKQSVTEIYNSEKKEKIIEITFLPIFFERITDRSCPMVPEMLNPTDRNGRSSRTDVYLSLLPLVMNNRWSHIYGETGYEKVMAQIKREGIIDPEKREKIIEESLTHAPLSFDAINEVRDTLKNYTELQPVEKQRFKRYLWEAMRFLIEGVGIISKKSYIDIDNKNIILVYNPDYPHKIKKTSKQPDKDFWEGENPYPDPRAKK